MPINKDSIENKSLLYKAIIGPLLDFHVKSGCKLEDHSDCIAYCTSYIPLQITKYDDIKVEATKEKEK